LYDLSDYPKDHKLYDVSNKKVIAKFKDELNGEIIREVVAIRSKMYSILTDDEHHKNRCKGIKTLYVKKYLDH
jgi:hypothetical protein